VIRGALALMVMSLASCDESTTSVAEPTHVCCSVYHTPVMTAGGVTCTQVALYDPSESEGCGVPTGSSGQPAAGGGYVGAGGGPVQVRGYTRSNGTYVAPYTRSFGGGHRR
jgi:hypothetical protein